MFDSAMWFEVQCDHCGDIAWLLTEPCIDYDDVTACMSCGFPGGISVDDHDEEDIGAYFRLDESPTVMCTRTQCEECLSK